MLFLSPLALPRIIFLLPLLPPLALLGGGLFQPFQFLLLTLRPPLLGSRRLLPFMFLSLAFLPLVLRGAASRHRNASSAARCRAGPNLNAALQNARDFTAEVVEPLRVSRGGKAKEVA